MITDTNIPSQEDFRFTEILDCTLPYHIVGYTAGTCPDSSNPYGYVPPTGWKVASCTMMPPGSHGVEAGQPAVLISCEPIKADVEPMEIGELTSVLYPHPSDNEIITGRAYSIPDVDGFYIEQPNYMRYAIYGITLSNLDYAEGEQIIAHVKLSSIYEDIIDVDQWGYTAELIDIKRINESEKLAMQEPPKLNLITALALGGAGVLLLGGYIWYNSHRK
jgi:hypothetical protein